MPFNVISAPTERDVHPLEDFDIEEEAQAINATSLPPTDGGKRAWFVLASCCLIQAPAWGYPVSFGVIQSYLASEATLELGDQSIATIGTTLSGVMYLSSPVVFTAMTKWPRLRRYVFPAGLVLAILGFVTSAFAKTICQLILTQGVIAGLGSTLLFSTSSLNLDEWWVRRKGLAYGIMLASKALTGAAAPLLFHLGLDRFGFRTVLLAWAVILVMLSIPTHFLSAPRVPLSQVSRSKPLNWSFLRLPSFWLLQTGNCVQAVGYMMPQTYIPSYATTLSLPSTIGTLMLSLYSLCSVFGGLFIGTSSDRFQISTCILISSLGSMFSVLFFWGFADHVALLSIFAVTYGFFAGGYSSTWGGVLKELKHEDQSVETGLMFGFLNGGRGIGFALSGPLSVALLDVSWKKGGEGGYGSTYGPMIVFTAVSALLGGWGACQRYIRRA